MIIKNSENQKLTLRNCTIDAVVFKAVLEAAAVNTSVDISDIDISKIYVKATLKRMGNFVTIFSDNMKVLAWESAFGSALWDYVNPANTANDTIILVAKDVAVKEIGIVPWEIKLGGCINLSGDDELTIEVQMNQPFGANVSSSASYMEFDANEAIGYEFYTPIIECRAIKANESRVQESIGDNVMAVSFLNFDKTAVTTASQVINSASVSTDRWNVTDTYYELLAKRVAQFETIAIAGGRYQSFVLASAQELDKVWIDLTLTSTNVNAGKNYLVIRRFYTDERLVELAQVRKDTHAHQAGLKFGLVRSDRNNVSGRLAQKKNLLKSANWRAGVDRA